MIQFAAIGVSALKELAEVLGDAIEDPDTYKKIEGLRQFLGKLTGKEIDKNGLVALLEETTQGEPYTGQWEYLGKNSAHENCDTRRLRVAGAWIYDIGRGNPILVHDK